MMARMTYSKTIIAAASLAQLVEHALRKRMVMGSIPIGGLPQIPSRRYHDSGRVTFCEGLV